MNGKTLLTLGAWLNFGIALLHAIIIFVGASGYLYFGAPDLARLDAQGSTLPEIMTAVLTLIFIAFGLYALSGAGRFHPLPLIKTALIGIGGIYTLRGLIVILDIIRLINGAGYPFRQTVFSTVALIVGLFYLIGAAQRWDALRIKQ